MKFLMSLGPNCEEASVKATSVTEKTVPATPIMAPDMVDKMLRAESELLTRKKRIQPSCGMATALSRETRAMDKNTAKLIVSAGKNQNVAVSSFQKKCSFSKFYSLVLAEGGLKIGVFWDARCCAFVFRPFSRFFHLFPLGQFVHQLV